MNTLAFSITIKGAIFALDYLKSSGLQDQTTKERKNFLRNRQPNRGKTRKKMVAIKEINNDLASGVRPNQDSSVQETAQSGMHLDDLDYGIIDHVVTKLPKADQARLNETSRAYYYSVVGNFNHRQRKLEYLLSTACNEEHLFEIFSSSKHALALQSIETLNLEGTTISESLLDEIAEHCPNLKKLSIAANKFENLEGLTKFPKLTHVAVDEQPLDFLMFNNNQALIDTIGKMGNLENLKIKLRSTKENLLNFQSWNELKNIETLEIETGEGFELPQEIFNEKLINVKINCSGLQNNHLNKLYLAKNLKSLNLEDCEELNHFPNRLLIQNLELINILETGIMLPLQHYSELQSLTCADDAIASHLLGNLSAPKLEHLYFCGVSEDFFLLTEQLSKLCFFKKITMAQFPIFDDVHDVNDAPLQFPVGSRFKELESLDIKNGIFDRKSLNFLEHASHLKNLSFSAPEGKLILPENINLNDLTSFSIMKNDNLADLYIDLSFAQNKDKLKNLEDISLQGEIFSDKDLDVLCTSTHLKRIEIKNTLCTKIPNINYTHLSELILESNNFYYEGLKSLSTATQIKFLKINQDGLEFPRINLQSCHEIDLNGIFLSNNQIKYIQQQQFPFLKIFNLNNIIGKNANNFVDVIKHERLEELTKKAPPRTLTATAHCL